MDKLISQLYGELQLAIHLSGALEPIKDDLSTYGCLKSLRNKAQQKQPRQISAPIATCLNS